jgi:hypothetical protein
MESHVRKTIITTVCTVATVTAIGAWALASIRADARYLVPAEMAMEGHDALKMTAGAKKDLPAQRFDAI